MEKLTKLYEGKAKILYKTEDQNQLIQYFKDDATAFNNVKKKVISKKGILNNFISEFLMQKLSEQNTNATLTLLILLKLNTLSQKD